MTNMLKITRSGAAKTLFTFLAVCVLLMSCIGFASAAEAERTRGWVEVKTTVPVGFNKDYLVLQAINMATGEEIAFQILAENDYVLRTQIPVGDYSIDLAFVYQDYRYSVTPDEYEFTVVEGVAAPIHLTVKMFDEYRNQEGDSTESPAPGASDAPADIPTEEPAVPPVEAPVDTPSEVPEDPETEDPAPADPGESTPPDATEKPEMDILTRIALGVLGTVVFCAVIYFAAFMIRRNMGED